MSDCEVEVKETVIVKGIAGDYITVSDNDVLMAAIPLGIVYYYSSSKNMEFSSLCSSLEKLLEHYPALAGTLKKRTTGGYDIECNNQGIECIHAKTSAKLSEIDFSNPLTSIPSKIFSMVNYSDPES